MHTICSRVRICFAVAVLGLTGVATGCGESGNPASPSPLLGGHTSPSVATTATSNTPGRNPLPELANLDAPASAAHLNPTELEIRGWTCFQPPVPNRIVCSRPHQGRPTVGFPPPDDRPATFTFLVFDGGGVFVGTELLIRTDLYKGQLCESTREPYILRGLIGYYECVRTVGDSLGASVLTQ
jgi:hypothetical protein